MNNLTALIQEFVQQRDWKQFHTPRTLATSILIESAELMEIFQWVRDDELEETVQARTPEIGNEMADVFIYLLLLADHMGMNLEQLAADKIKKNEQRYPIEKAKGNAVKHTEL